MNQVILSYKENYKGIKNTFSNPASNGCIEGTNRRIKQIDRTGYGYGNPHSYFSEFVYNYLIVTKLKLISRIH